MSFIDKDDPRHFKRVDHPLFSSASVRVAGLLEKKQRVEHPDYLPDLNFKKAKTESSGEQKELI